MLCKNGIFEVFKNDLHDTKVVGLNPLAARNSCEEFACSFYVCVCSSQLLPFPSYICDRWITDPKLTFAVNVSV